LRHIHSNCLLGGRTSDLYFWAKARWNPFWDLGHFVDSRIVSAVDVLVICGAAGVGKSTVTWEIGRQLQIAGVRHAIIDTDELDRVYPQPEPLSELVVLSRRNLKALWESFAALGHSRLMLSGVFLDLEADLSWINGSLEDADITVVRLLASDETLRQRVESREIGSAREEQTHRTLAQAEALRQHTTERAVVVETDGRHPVEIAQEILGITRWALIG
jgi:broad-specificity NMP kinase